MKKIVLVLLLTLTSLMAELQTVWATPKFLENKMKIIDIRTAPEWKETGIVKGAYTITFFDERGNYNTENFLAQLNRVVKKGEKFALICRTGSRTTMVSQFLANKQGYNVVNLNGGMMKLIQEGYKAVRYKQ